LAHAAELQRQTAAAFDRYTRATEARLAKTATRDGPFLFIDARPANRAEAYAALGQGRVLVEPVNADEGGRPIEAPYGLIHDWVGLVFIPGATLERTLAVIQDYDNEENIYAPEVRRSKLLKHEGDYFEVYLQLYKETIVTVVLNGDFDIRYERLSASRAISRTSSTRLAEVADLGQPGEHELPVDGGHGSLWRLHNYWRYEERGGGVYVQPESIGLSRNVPFGFGWLVNPLLRSIPRRTLEALLTRTRIAVLGQSRSATRL
jgi:hypothetical protein